MTWSIFLLSIIINLLPKNPKPSLR